MEATISCCCELMSSVESWESQKEERMLAEGSAKRFEGLEVLGDPDSNKPLSSLDSSIEIR